MSLFPKGIFYGFLFFVFICKPHDCNCLAQTSQINWFWGTGLTFFDYKELLVLPKKSQERGWIPYIGMEYQELYPLNHIKLSQLIQMGYGKTLYDGSRMNSVTNEVSPLTGQTTHVFLNLETTFAFQLQHHAAMWEPYMGMGYHFWNRRLEGNVPFYEKYTWLCFPLGLRFQVMITPSLVWGGDFSFRPVAFGTMNLDRTLYGISSDIVFQLGNKAGWKAAFPIAWQQNFFILSITPWYAYSAIGESDRKRSVSGGLLGSVELVEPESSTHQYGVWIQFVLSH